MTDPLTPASASAPILSAEALRGIEARAKRLDCDWNGDDFTNEACDFFDNDAPKLIASHRALSAEVARLADAEMVAWLLAGGLWHSRMKCYPQVVWLDEEYVRIVLRDDTENPTEFDLERFVDGKTELTDGERAVIRACPAFTEWKEARHA